MQQAKRKRIGSYVDITYSETHDENSPRYYCQDQTFKTTDSANSLKFPYQSMTQCRENLLPIPA